MVNQSKREIMMLSNIEERSDIDILGDERDLVKAKGNRKNSLKLLGGNPS